MRFLTRLVLISTVALAGPALAGKKADCTDQASIVSRAVELRLESKGQKKTLATMTSGADEAVAERYLQAVPHLVDWVYSLKRKDLKQDPGASYLQACLSQ